MLSFSGLARADLVKRGLAHRRSDTDDARSTLITITARGERQHDAIVPVRQALQDELETAAEPQRDCGASPPQTDEPHAAEDCERG
jgi:DNA-binding MarR family transcriptional regulator